MAKNKKEETKAQQAAEAAAEEVSEVTAEETAEAQPASETDAQVEALKKQLDEMKDSKLRLAAEYDNFRKRSQREKDSIYADASLSTAAKFLPVLDNLERAAKQETSDEAYKKGVEMTLSQMYQVMEKMGIVEIPALGEQFDPELHNAVLHIEDESIDDNTIVEVFEKGFKMGDRVLRHSIVKVAN